MREGMRRVSPPGQSPRGEKTHSVAVGHMREMSKEHDYQVGIYSIH